MISTAIGLSFTVVSGPSNGLLSGTAPNLTYTPAADFNGSDSFTFTANDGTVDSAIATVSITISAGNDDPVAIAQSLTTAEDAPLAIALAGTDSDGDALTYSASTPANGTLTGTAPNLTYTPAPDFNGSDGFSFTVDDGTSTGSALVSINVSAVNDAPIVAAVPAPITAIEDSGTVTANIAGMFDDVDLTREGDSLTLSVSGVSNASMFTPPPTIGGTTLTMPLAPDQNGTVTVTLRAQDASGTGVTGDVTLNVTPVNDAPTVTTPIPDQNPPEDSPPIVLDLSPHFGDVDGATNGDTLTYSVTMNDNAAIVSTAVAGSNLTLTFPPNVNGVAHITVHAQDAAGASIDDTFTVTVDSVDDTPVAADDSATMNEDEGMLSIDVLANDTHGDDPTTIVNAGTTVTIAGVPYPNSSETTPTSVLDATGTTVTLPNGSLVINGNSIEYTPKQDFNGTDHFSYTIRDADGQTSTATVTVVVNSVNDAPVQSSTVSYTVVQGSFLDILAAGGIASHGFDADTDAITVIQDTAPNSIGMGYAGTTLGVQPDGAFLYTPDVTFVGSDSFVIRLYDGVTTSGPINVIVNVTAAAPPPPPPPAGEVEFNFNLAKVPLEDAISSEANVLVIMDDSGSMDWAVMTDGAEGEFWLTNAGIKDSTRRYRDDGISVHHAADAPTSTATRPFCRRRRRSRPTRRSTATTTVCGAVGTRSTTPSTTTRRCATSRGSG